MCSTSVHYNIAGVLRGMASCKICSLMYAYELCITSATPGHIMCYMICRPVCVRMRICSRASPAALLVGHIVRGAELKLTVACGIHRRCSRSCLRSTTVTNNTRVYIKMIDATSIILHMWTGPMDNVRSGAGFTFHGARPSPGAST